MVIPARDEASTIGDTVRAALGLPGVSRVIVVDDGSRDDTAREARLAGAEVVSLAKRLGKGGALSLGIRDLDEDVVVFLDGDLGQEVRKASVLLDPLRAGSADMCVAGVVTEGKGGFGIVRSVASWGIRRLTGSGLSCPLSGQRALRREMVEALDSLAAGFGVEVGLTIDALSKGYHTVEVPSGMVHQGTGKSISGFVHRGRQLWDVLRALLDRGLLSRGWLK